MIEAKNLSGGADSAASVNQISFRRNNGGVLGIVGAADASALLALLSGALLPSAGQVRLNGFDLHAERARAQELVGYLPASFLPDPDLTPAEYLLFVADAKGMEYHQAIRRVQALLDRTGLDALRNTLIRKLSHAQKRLLGIAQTLLASPEFILLDVPTEGLSVRDTLFVREWIAQIGEEKTVLLTARTRAETRGLCDTVLLLQNGRATELSPEDAPDASTSTVSAESNVQASPIAPPAKPPKKSRWRLLTDATAKHEEIDDEKENRR